MDENTTQGGSVSPSAPLPQMLNTLLSNPELMGRIKEMMTSAPVATEPKSADVPGEPTNTSQNPPAIPTQTPPGTDGLANILSDPNILAKLPQILAVMKPLLSGIPSEPTSAQPAVALQSTATESKSLPVCRDNLLLALKPFLSPERCQAIDSMIRIAKLGEVLGQIK